MVDRVELVLLEQLQQVRELDRDRSRRLEDFGHAGDEVVEIRHLGQHVVAEDEVGLDTVGCERCALLLAEERHVGGYADLDGGLGDVRCRLDAEARDAGLDEVLEEVAVVAGELDDHRVGAEAEPLGDHVDIVRGVLQPRRGERREVGVLLEDLAGVDVLVELHEEALMAHPDVQRVEGLHRIQRVGGKEALTERRHSEVDDTVFERGGTKAARERSHRGRRYRWPLRPAMVHFPQRPRSETALP